MQELARQLDRDSAKVYDLAGLKRPAPTVPASSEPTEIEKLFGGVIDWSLKKQLEESRTEAAKAKEEHEQRAAAHESERARMAAEHESIVANARREAEAVRVPLVEETERLRALLVETDEANQTIQRAILEHGKRATAAEERAAKAEREAEELRARPANAEVKYLHAPAPEPQPLEIKPQHDDAGLLRGLLLKGKLQTVLIKILRDGAEEPISLQVEPQ